MSSTKSEGSAKFTPLPLPWTKPSHYQILALPCLTSIIAFLTLLLHNPGIKKLFSSNFQASSEESRRRGGAHRSFSRECGCADANQATAGVQQGTPGAASIDRRIGLHSTINTCT